MPGSRSRPEASKMKDDRYLHSKETTRLATSARATYQDAYSLVFL